MDSYDKLKPDDIPWLVVLIVLVVGWMETYRTSNQHSPRCCTCYWEQLEKVSRGLSFGHKSEVGGLAFWHMPIIFHFTWDSLMICYFYKKMVNQWWPSWSRLLALSLLILLFQLAQRWPSLELVWVFLLNETLFSSQSLQSRATGELRCVYTPKEKECLCQYNLTGSSTQGILEAKSRKANAPFIA